jgi:hypothetical protein
MKEHTVDFNEVMANQIHSAVVTEAVSSELKIQDGGFQITILIEKIFEEEE